MFAEGYAFYGMRFLHNRWCIERIEKSCSFGVFNRIRNFNKLNIVDLEDSLADDVLSFHESLSNKLTYTESSIIFYAKKNDCVILSSDWNFLNIAKQYVPKVYNLLQVFEGMARKKVLDYSQAAEFLEDILETNHCLPKEECESVLKKNGRANKNAGRR